MGAVSFGRADRNVQDFCDLVIGHFFESAHFEDNPVGFRKLPECFVKPSFEFHPGVYLVGPAHVGPGRFQIFIHVFPEVAV